MQTTILCGEIDCDGVIATPATAAAAIDCPKCGQSGAVWDPDRGAWVSLGAYFATNTLPGESYMADEMVMARGDEGNDE